MAKTSPRFTVPSPSTSVQVTRRVVEPIAIGVASPLAPNGRLVPVTESICRLKAYRDGGRCSLAAPTAKLTFPFDVWRFAKTMAGLGGVPRKVPNSDTTATMMRTRIVRTRAFCPCGGGTGYPGGPYGPCGGPGLGGGNGGCATSRQCASD